MEDVFEFLLYLFSSLLTAGMIVVFITGFVFFVDGAIHLWTVRRNGP